MPRSVYFSQTHRQEQNLLEDLLIESMQIMGHDVFYIPRKIVKQDFILNEDVISSFDKSFSIEMYVESVDGFEGDGDLMTKFGLEIRDQLTLVCSRKRWNSLIGRHGYTNDSVRPREGDLIYVPLTGGLFEIKFVEDKNPFFQLGGSGRSKGNNPLFKLVCELFEYGGQEIDTDIPIVDNIQVAHSRSYRSYVEFDDELHTLGETLTIELPSGVTGEAEALRYEHTDDGTILSTGLLTFDDGAFHQLAVGTTFTGQTSGTTSIIPSRSYVEFDDELHTLGEMLTITLPSGVTGETEALRYTHTDDGTILSTGLLTFDDGAFHQLVVDTTFTGQTSGTTSTITSTISSLVGLMSGDATLFENDDLTQNSSFDIEGNNFIDFSESNPFGEPI